MGEEGDPPGEGRSGTAEGTDGASLHCWVPFLTQGGEIGKKFPRKLIFCVTDAAVDTWRGFADGTGLV